MVHRAWAGLACAAVAGGAMGQLGSPPGGAVPPPSVYASTWKVPSPPPPPPSLPDEMPDFRAQLAERSAAIDAELAALDRKTLPDTDWAKEWAGVYSFGGGACQLKIAPKSGVALIANPASTDRVHVYSGWLNFGSITAGSLDGLTLKMRLDDRDRWLRSESPLVFIAWGSLRFALPERELLDAVNTLNAGTSIDGWLEQAEGLGEAFIPVSTNVSGRSQLPSKYKALVHDAPLRCKVTRVYESENEATEGGILVRRRVRVDLGRRDRAFVGMYITRSIISRFDGIELDMVAEDFSEGLYTGFAAEHTTPVEPAEGMEFTLPGAAHPVPPEQ